MKLNSSQKTAHNTATPMTNTQNSFRTIATFAEHTSEMIETTSDRAELLKRHRASLERLRNALQQLLDGAK